MLMLMLFKKNLVFLQFILVQQFSFQDTLYYLFYHSFK